MIVSLIVAMTENHVIGLQGDMPWRMSADLKRFKRITMGHHMIMGRKTFDSIGRPLPGRTTIVLSRGTEPPHPDVLLASSWDDAIALCGEDDEVFVCGGAEIYRLALPHVQRVYLTQLACELEGDTHFPQVDWGQWQLIDQQQGSADERNQFDYQFLTYERT